MKPFLCILLIIKCLFLQEHSQPVLLPAGTPVFLEPECHGNDNNLAVGSTIGASVKAPVVINGKIVIAKGAFATIWVKSVSKINRNTVQFILVAESVQAVDGQFVRIRSADMICIKNKDKCSVDFSIMNLKALVLSDIRINS